MNKYLVILGCFLAFALSGCSGEEEDDLIDVLAYEKQAIHNYLNQYATGEVVAIPYYSRKGLLIDSIFIFNHNTSGEVAKDSGWVTMDYDMSDLSGTILDSSDPEKWDNESYTPGYAYGGPVLYRVDTARYNFLGEAFRHIGVGGSGGEVIIPSVLGAVDGKTLHYKLKSYTIFEDVAEHEKEMIQGYLNIFPAVETFKDYPGEVESDTITYTLLMTKGEGTRKLQVGDSLLMSKHLVILDDMGTGIRLKFMNALDTTKILFNERWQRDFPAGFVKGLQQLQEGDSAHIVIPYGMGYGAKGNVQSIKGGGTYYNEPPYCTFGYWVKIMKIVAPNTEEE